MAGFALAVEAGAHALETDLHLSQDKQVMLSHVRTPAIPDLAHTLMKTRMLP